MRRVVVISTGGTIASRWQGEGYAAQADGSEVLASAPVPEGLDVRVVDLFTVNSSRITTAHQLELLRTVREVLTDPEVAGVVVTHGTDTLEESAYLLSLFHDDPRPVVFTGAQQPLEVADGDAPGNLYDALLTASCGRDTGVVIVFAGLVHEARGTVKVHTLAPQAFADPCGSPLGRVEFGRVTWLRRPDRTPALEIRLPGPGGRLPRVDIVMHHTGADTLLLDAVLAAGAEGVVLVGTGAGNATPDIAAAVARAVDSGVLVALSTRVQTGPVAALYTGGGAVDLAAAGALLSGSLRAGQTRIAVLASLLSAGPAATAAERTDVLRRVLDGAAVEPPLSAPAGSRRSAA